MEKAHSTLYSIQALRGIAALLVLFFHIFELQSLTPGNPKDLIDGPWARGYAGVDLFFVISGFIMVYITDARQGSLANAGRFIANRVTRIYPLWWLLCAILAAYYILTTGRAVSPDLSGRINGDGLYLLRSFLLIPQDVPPINGLGWTLIHEMYFYVIFAVLLLLPARARYFGLWIWGVVTALLFGFGFAAYQAGSVLQLGASLLTLEFLAGAGAAWLILRGYVFAPKLCLILGIICAICALLFYKERGQDLMLWGRVAVYTLPFALIIYGAVALERAGRLSVPRALIRLGDWSYSLYLSHLLVLGVIIRILPKVSDSLAPTAAGITGNLIFIGLGLGAAIGAAALFYYGAERPLLRLMRRSAASRGKPS